MASPFTRRPAAAGEAYSLASHHRGVGDKLSHRLLAREVEAWLIGEPTPHLVLVSLLFHNRNALVTPNYNTENQPPAYFCLAPVQELQNALPCRELELLLQMRGHFCWPKLAYGS